jgi:zinc D-Ala-D-Ala carboxypeptidase
VRSDKSDSEKSVRPELNEPLVKMFGAAEEAGYSLIIGSGYRSAALQQTYLNSAINSIGLEAANQAIALPGQSEHQTGLAVDISSASLGCYLDECFSGTDDGKWLSSNSYKYGFILRYPKGKETITGYQYEPWHFRYVGIELATALFESNLTLDEAWPYILEARNKLHENGAI